MHREALHKMFAEVERFAKTPIWMTTTLYPERPGLHLDTVAYRYYPSLATASCFVLFKCAMYVLVVRLRRYSLWIRMPELCLCLLVLLLLLLLHSVGEEGNVRTLRVSASSCFKVLFPATAVLCFTSVLLRVAAGEYSIALE